MPIVNHTDYTLHAYREYFELHARRPRIVFLILALLTPIPPLLFAIVVCILNSELQISPVRDPFFWSCIMQGIINLVVFLIIRAKVTSNSVKQAEKMARKNITCTYTFVDEHIEIASTIHTRSRDEVKKSENLPYSKILLVRQVKSAYFLYIQSNNAYIVSKIGFTQGTEEELVALLRKNIPAHKWKLD